MSADPQSVLLEIAKAERWSQVPDGTTAAVKELTEARADAEATIRRLREALEFVRDWADDCADGDTVFGFDAIATRARRVLADTAPEGER